MTNKKPDSWRATKEREKREEIKRRSKHRSECFVDISPRRKGDIGENFPLNHEKKRTVPFLPTKSGEFNKLY